jgi:hypothetical protein
MFMSFEDVQKFSKDNLGVATESYNLVTKGIREIATETADYTKKSFETSTATYEKLVGAKSLDKALEIQNEYARTAYEAYVAQASKIGAALTNLTKDSFKPFEGALSRTIK